MNKLKLFREISVFVFALIILIGGLSIGNITVHAEETAGKWSDYAAEAFGGGAGTVDNPYKIETAAQMAAIPTNTSDYFILVNDIDMSDHYWVPIGAFNGTLDGNGKTISGIIVNDNTVRNIGLFQAMYGTIKNLTVDVNIDVNGHNIGGDGVGGITSALLGTLDNCSVTGSINVNATNTKIPFVGGLAGYVYAGSTITNCSNSANISGGSTAKDARVGGIAGYVAIDYTPANGKTDILIANCYNTGNITAPTGNSPCVAGIAGYVAHNQATGFINIYNVYNSGVISSGETVSAAVKANIVAVKGTDKVKTAYLYGNTTLDTELNSFNIVDNMTDATFAQTLNTNADALAEAGTCRGLFRWKAVEGSVPTFANFCGGGTEEDPFMIGNAAQLVFWKDNAAEYKNSHFVLINNIDMSEYNWTPISEFHGTFDGNGKTISGLTIQNNDLKESVGLIKWLYGTVKNLTVDVDIDVKFTKGNGVAGIAGELLGTLDNCSVTGSINATSESRQALVGGLAGYVCVGSTITNCTNNANISGGSTTKYATIGGIAGYVAIDFVPSHGNMDILIANCYNTGDITVLSEVTPSVAGITGKVAHNQASGFINIYNVYNAGDINANASTAKKANIVAEKAADKVNTAYLYGNTTLADVFLCNIVEDMTNESFVKTLNINADILVGEGKCTGLWGWQTVAGSVPTFSSTAVEGNLKTLNVSVNDSRMGSVAMKVDENGGTNYVDAVGNIFKNGSSVQLTINPTAGCKITKLILNDEEQTVNGTTFEFVLDGKTEIEVVFEVESTEDVAPIYVDPNAQAGGDGTESAPFTTLEEAQAKLRSILSTQKNANVTICLMDGVYRLNKTLVLGVEDTSLGRVTFKNYEGANPVITSGHSISAGAFAPVEGKGYYSYQLPETAKEQGAWPQFRDLLVDGERATVAKTESFEFLYTYPNSQYSGSKVTACDNKLYISPDALAGITNENLSGVELGSVVEWKFQIFHIASLTGENQGGELEVTLNAEEWDRFYRFDTNKRSLVGREYWLQNHINFLDEPGEFYYDQANGVVYYYPYEGQNMDTAQIEYATVDRLIELNNAANFTFEGLSFTGTTMNYIADNGFVGEILANITVGADMYKNVPCAALYGTWATGIYVNNCSFEELGGTAILFDDGAKDIQIIGNRIRNVGMLGVKVGQSEYDWADGASEDVKINNNYITNIGLLISSAPAISVGRCENLEIQHNTIVHVPYSGICVGFGFTHQLVKNTTNADISYNFITDYVYKANDGSGIYVCGMNAAVDNTELINEIHHNYMRAGAHNVANSGIYHDGSASNWHTHSNVIEDVVSSHGPMFFQDHVARQYTHNITADNNFTTVSEILQSGNTDENGKPRNIVLQNNTMVSDRSMLSEAAIAIKNGAGVQDAYKHLVKPMDVELRIADSTLHYVVNLKNEGNTTMQMEIINNSANAKTYNISIDRVLPSGIELIINDGNSVNVPAGEKKIIDAEFVITDANKVLDRDPIVVGFMITDSTTQKVYEYPRTFTIKTTTGNISGEVPYGTPVIDGIMDDVYKQGSMTSFGPVFHPDEYAASDIEGGYYLAWDENYLYCYVIVNEGTIMTRGTDWITEQIATGNQGNLWETDAVETYLYVSSVRPSKICKFAVDAFGIKRFGNAGIALTHHDLPYATKFTYNGEIIDAELPTTLAAGQTATNALGTTVNGYVVEMTLPITQIDSILASEDGVPSAGDTFEFYIQNNDYQGLTSSGAIYTVAKANAKSVYTLKEKVIPVETEDLEKAMDDAEAAAQAGYTADSLAALEKALEEAKAILGADSATQDQVDAAEKAVKDAIAALVKKTVEIVAEKSNASYTLESGNPVVIYSTGDLAEVTGVKMDGVTIDAKNYTLKAGSTVLELKPEYVETLAKGTHTVTLEYTLDRAVEWKLEILENTTNNDSGDTNDTNDKNDTNDNKTQDSVVQESNASSTIVASGAKTGDESHIGLWLMLFVMSIAAFGIVVFSVKKNRK